MYLSHVFYDGFASLVLVWEVLESDYFVHDKGVSVFELLAGFSPCKSRQEHKRDINAEDAIGYCISDRWFFGSWSKVS